MYSGLYTLGHPSVDPWTLRSERVRRSLGEDSVPLPFPAPSIPLDGLSEHASPTCPSNMRAETTPFLVGMAHSFLLSRSQICAVPAGLATPNIDDIKGLSGTTGDTTVMVGSLKVDEKKRAMDKEKCYSNRQWDCHPRKTPQEKEKPAQIGSKLTCAPFSSAYIWVIPFEIVVWCV